MPGLAQEAKENYSGDSYRVSRLLPRATRALFTLLDDFKTRLAWHDFRRRYRQPRHEAASYEVSRELFQVMFFGHADTLLLACAFAADAAMRRSTQRYAGARRCRKMATTSPGREKSNSLPPIFPFSSTMPPGQCRSHG